MRVELDPSDVPVALLIEGSAEELHDLALALEMAANEGECGGVLLTESGVEPILVRRKV